MKHFLLLPIFLVVLTRALCQENYPTVIQAEEAYARHEYARAAHLYEKINTFRHVPPNAPGRLANCYRELNQYSKAAKIYEKITGQRPEDQESWVYYGDVLKSLGKYQEAKAAYRRAPDSLNPHLAMRIAGCDSALTWMAAPSAYTVSNLRAANTSFSDWGAEWYGDHSIVFTSDSLRTRALGKGSRADREIYRRTGHPFQKLYVADSTSRGVGAIRGFAPVMNFNTYHDGPVAFSPGGDTAYFTVTNPGALKDPGDKVSYTERKKIITWSLRRLEILWTVKDSTGNWGPSRPFAYNNPASYSVGHAALSPDGQVLYFTSDMPGGYGRTDIWYVERQGDSAWSAPINCGPEINTEDEEAFPTIGKDGRLYFASKGHAGMGGYDVFIAIGERNHWQSVRNLGYPLNSSGDDFYFTVKDSLSGFLSSDRPGGKGSDDIYRYVVIAGPPVVGSTFPTLRVIILKTQVLDSASGEPIEGAAIVVSHVKKGLRWTTITGQDGMEHQVIEPEAEYTDSAFKKGYTAGGTHVSTVGVKGPDTLSVQVFLQKSLITGVVYILKNLYYDYNKSYIRPDAALVLDKLVDYLRQYPHLAIELSSHTDSRGADAYNLSLSMRRAQSALKYLQEHGVAPGRVTIRGYGETRLVNGCSNNVPCTPAQHQANRRTEIRVLHP